MARSQEPLLRRPSTEQEDRGNAEEDALLTGNDPNPKIRHRQWREIGVSVWAIVATVAVIVLAVLFHESKNSPSDNQSSKPKGKRNLIFMVSDGMGPTSLAMTRSFRQYKEGLPFDDTLVLDRYEIGKSRTRSTSSLVTDSAAGATAFACGMKSYNGAISTLPDHTPCGTVLEAAKKAGYMTGLVVTTRITDATPACFAAHVNKREEEDRIAEQLLGEHPLGHLVDLMLGAGRGFFLPNTTEGSSRSDDRDMIKLAKKKGFSYVGNREAFDNLNLGGAVKLPLLGLFANEDIPYEIDRQHQTDEYPSLQEMAETALTALTEATRDSEQGFFLMIEGSRIDHAGHANDPAAQVHEVLAYDDAFSTVTNFLDESSTPGLLVATSDHETGGLSTARENDPYTYPIYRWFPQVLLNATQSHHFIARKYAEYLHTHHLPSTISSPSSSSSSSTTSEADELATRDAATFLHTLIKEHLGIHDASDSEVNTILHQDLIYTGWLLSSMISRRAQTGWSTHGHSGADVNIYASNAEVAGKLRGNVENTAVGKFLAEYLGVDVESVTRELLRKTEEWDAKYEGNGEEWMGKKIGDGEASDGGSHLERYQGGFRRLAKREACEHEH